MIAWSNIVKLVIPASQPALLFRDIKAALVRKDETGRLLNERTIYPKPKTVETLTDVQVCDACEAW